MPAQFDVNKTNPFMQTEIQRYVIALLMPRCTSEPLRFNEHELSRSLKVHRRAVAGIRSVPLSPVNGKVWTT